MKALILNWNLCVAVFLFFIHESYSFPEFRCLKGDGVRAPVIPLSYSTDVRINFLTDAKSVDVKHATVSHGGKDFMEFKSENRRVKYIVRREQKKVLIINYKADEQPTCTVKDSLDVMDFIETEEAGTLAILPKFITAISDETAFHFAGLQDENGMTTLRWEGCITNPRINVSYSFAPQGWKQPYVSSLIKNANYLVSAYAQIDKTEMSLLFSNFDPSPVDETIFQPPADVYCEGFRTDKKPPKMPDYFSYTAEILTYENADGISPLVSNRKVHYDKHDEISRMDFYDPLRKDQDMFSPISASVKSVIRDHNAGVQYEFNPITGKCKEIALNTTANVIYNLKNKTMATGNEFFLLDNKNFAYNGQFAVRGMMADVYTAKKENPDTKKKTVISWFFSTEETRIVETENVEKNVLLRMNIRPETAMGKEDLVEINFYNFAREEPTVITRDLSSCLYKSTARFMVLTFPANELLNGSGILVEKCIHSALIETTGLRKQRILIREVVFTSSYLYAEFALLGASSFTKQSPSQELSVDDALKKLQNAVSGNNFKVDISLEKTTIVLKPEPNGLNEYAGDRHVKSTGYKEGSVIGLAVGMLLLGVLLGSVAINLIISRKFGVSLFQKSNYGNEPFSNRLGESSM